MEFIFQIGLVLLFVLLNGYFVASEFALVSVRKTRITELAKKGSKRAKMVQGAIDELDNYISATQLGITLASLALGWIGEPAIAHFLEPFFRFLPETLAVISSHTLAVAIAFTIITTLHIVLGELAPKSIALQRSEATALFIITPLVIFSKIFKPFIHVLNGAGQLVVRLFGLHETGEGQTFHSEEEIKTLLRQSSLGGTIPRREVEMVYNVFQFGDIPVRVIMVPRTEVLAFSSKTTLEEIAKHVENHPHSRFPIYDKSIDDIRGFIHVKDLYRELLKDSKKQPVGKCPIIRETITVPEMKKIDSVLQDMRKQQVHMAVVNDEFGGTAGIVTLEDILESLVGEIQDEFDQPMKEIVRLKDGTYTVDGHTLISDFQERFKLPMKGQGYTTIGGLVFGLLGHEPEVGETVQIGNLQLTVAQLQGKRVKSLTLKKMKLNKESN
jgi:CBS domain containing-hemolysin-like protein